MKTLIKLANSNSSSLSHYKSILFHGKTARSTNIDSHAIIENGAWDFVNPTVVAITDLKIAMSLSKEQKWHGNTLNGVQLKSAMPAEDFLPLPEYLRLNSFTPIHADNLADTLVKVSPAMADKDVRYYLKGICFDFGEGVIVATDGHRMHLVKNAFTPQGKGQAIIPAESIKLIGAKNITAVAFSATHCRIDLTGGYVISRLVDGKFPDWQRVCPKESDRPHVVAFGQKQIDVCKTLDNAIRATERPKRLDNPVCISCIGDITFNDSIYLDLTLDMFDSFPITYGANISYITAALSAAQEGVIRLNEANDSMLIQNGNFSAVVMPRKIPPVKPVNPA